MRDFFAILIIGLLVMTVLAWAWPRRKLRVINAVGSFRQYEPVDWKSIKHATIQITLLSGEIITLENTRCTHHQRNDEEGTISIEFTGTTKQKGES